MISKRNNTKVYIKKTLKFFHVYGGKGEAWGPGGHLKPPLWSLENIRCVVTNILHAAVTISHITTSILSDVPDMLHVQHQFFEFFQSVLGYLNPIRAKSARTFFRWLFLHEKGGLDVQIFVTFPN